MYENRVSNPKLNGFLLPRPDDSSIVYISRGFDRIDSQNINCDNTIEVLKQEFWRRGKNVFARPRKNYGFDVTTNQFIDEEVKEVEKLIEKGYEDINVLGISYGALIALNLGLKFTENINKIFLRAPLVDLPGMISGKYDKFMSPASKEYFSKIHKTYKSFILNGKEQDIFSKLKDFNTPTFCLHSRGDVVIPYEHTKRLVQVLRGYGHKEIGFKFMDKRRHECNPNENCSMQFNMMFNFFYK